MTEGMFILILLAVLLILIILFYATQASTLQEIRPENRLMPPGQVWIQLIPIFGLIWHFVVVNKISNSILNELNTPISDSVLEEEPVVSHKRPTYAMGMTYTICFCMALIPFPLTRLVAGVVGIICWLIYWAQLSECKLKIKQRYLTLNTSTK